MRVPYGALPVGGFSLDADIRQVAEHYGVRRRELRLGRVTGENMDAARAALMWHLAAVRQCKPAHIASWLNCTPETVADAVNAHAARLDAYERSPVRAEATAPI